MSRRSAVAVLVVAAVAVLAAPAWGATPLSRIKKLERQVRAAVALQLLHDQVRTATVEAPIIWQANYGTGVALCPAGMAVTGGGVRWNGQFGIDSAVIASYDSGGGWTAGVRAGAGTTGSAVVQAVCSALQ